MSSNISSSNRDLVLAMWKNMEEHNIPALTKMMTDDFKLTILPASLGIPVHNKEQAVKLLSSIFEKRSNIQTIHNEWVESEDSVAVQFTVTATLANGSPYKSDYMAIYRFKDGKMVHMKEFLDSKYLSELHSQE
ncbi:hypothetical protein BDQ17DRAFT_691630 [Cyathus striatus]|nr:hypothetical protein BDQ17DRAFT_691630 [Cyathus striatus]